MKTVVVKGHPVSINASTRSKSTWRQKVVDAASIVFTEPLEDDDLRVVITIFSNEAIGDTDNYSKPICDALKGIVYNDDSQIMERNARRRDLNGSFHIKGVEPTVAVAIAEGQDFVSIKIEKVGEGVVLI